MTTIDTGADIGTVRWFGRSWGAAVCDPRTHIDTPVGHICPWDGSDIEPRDRGINVAGPDGRSSYHLACFLYAVGAR